MHANTNAYTRGSSRAPAHLLHHELALVKAILDLAHGLRSRLAGRVGEVGEVRVAKCLARGKSGEGRERRV